jgi:hypothetical protein
MMFICGLMGWSHPAGRLAFEALIWAAMPADGSNTRRMRADEDGFWRTAQAAFLTIGALIRGLLAA